MITRLYRRLRRWLRRRFERPRFSRVERAAELSDLPEELASDTVYLTGPTARPKWAAFLCPCDRGHQVSLSLQTSHHPHWDLRLEGGRPTLYPSIDVPNEWRCHYWIVRGSVRWAPAWPNLGSRET